VRRIFIVALAEIFSMPAAIAGRPDLAESIYTTAKTAKPDTKLTQWDGQAVSFSGKVWVSPNDTTSPTLMIPAGAHSNLQATCTKPLNHPPALAENTPARLIGIIADVRRINQTSGNAGMWLLALSGGATLLSAPPVVVTLDKCVLSKTA
jgi:hypothetical protein